MNIYQVHVYQANSSLILFELYLLENEALNEKILILHFFTLFLVFHVKLPLTDWSILSSLQFDELKCICEANFQTRELLENNALNEIIFIFHIPHFSSFRIIPSSIIIVFSCIFFYNYIIDNIIQGWGSVIFISNIQ